MPIDVSGFTLPEIPRNESDGIERLSNNIDRNREWNYRLKKEKEADDWRKVQLIKDQVNPEKLATGEISSKEYFDNLAEEKQNEILNDAGKGGSLLDLQGVITKKWIPIVSAANDIKSGLNAIDESAKNQAKDDKYLNVDRLAAQARKNFLDERMPIDPKTGKRQPSTSQNIPQRDYINDLLNSDAAYQYYDYTNDQKGNPLEQYIRNTPTTPLQTYKMGSDNRVVNFLGKMTKNRIPNYKPNSEGQIPLSADPSLSVKSEKGMIQEGGKNMEIPIISSDIWEEDFVKNPQNMKVLNHMWAKYKDDNGIKSANPSEEETRKRAFLLGMYEKNDPGFIGQHNVEKTPKNTTYNNFSLGPQVQPYSGTGNVLNEINLVPGQKDGWYDMGKEGNKRNMAGIMQLLPEGTVTPGQLALDDKEQKVSYEVKNGKVTQIRVGNTNYNREYFERQQRILDKEPKWSGSLKFPSDQATTKEKIVFEPKNNLGGGNKSENPQPIYIINGAEYSKDQLLKSGKWDESKIEQAIKSGKISKKAK